MPPPLENATLASGRPSAAAVRLTRRANPSATRSPRLLSFWRIGSGLPPSSSNSRLADDVRGQVGLVRDQRVADLGLQQRVLGRVVRVGRSRPVDQRAGPDRARGRSTVIDGPAASNVTVRRPDVAVLALGGDERDVLDASPSLRSRGVGARARAQFGSRDEPVAGVGQEIVGTAGDDDVDVRATSRRPSARWPICRCEDRMILFTPASVRRCASALTIPATSALNFTFAARRCSRSRRRDADDADPLAALVDDGRVGDPARCCAAPAERARR